MSADVFLCQTWWGESTSLLRSTSTTQAEQAEPLLVDRTDKGESCQNWEHREHWLQACQVWLVNHDEAFQKLNESSF